MPSLLLYLLVTQTSSDSMWEGLHNGDSSQWWDHRGRGCTWRLAATIFPSHSPLPSPSVTLGLSLRALLQETPRR